MRPAAVSIELRTRYGIFVQSVTVIQPVQTFPSFMEPIDSSLGQQKIASGPYSGLV
jgi:hypothetical protein